MNKFSKKKFLAIIYGGYLFMKGSVHWYYGMFTKTEYFMW